MVVGLEANNIVPEAAVGIQCTYTYSCSFDLPSSRRSTVLSCSENGQWKGKMPDCSEDDEIVSCSYRQIFNDFFKKIIFEFSKAFFPKFLSVIYTQKNFEKYFSQVQTIIQFFSEDLSQINELEENRVNFTETKIDEKKSLNLTGSRTQALKSKNKTLNNARNQALDRLCDSKTMCRTLRGAHQCIRVGKYTKVTG